MSYNTNNSALTLLSELSETILESREVSLLTALFDMDTFGILIWSMLMGFTEGGLVHGKGPVQHFSMDVSPQKIWNHFSF